MWKCVIFIGIIDSIMHFTTIHLNFIIICIFLYLYAHYLNLSAVLSFDVMIV